MKVSEGYLECVAANWQRAYFLANGKDAPSVRWENGWFRVGTLRYRRRRLEEMTENLKHVGQRGTAAVME